MKWILQPSGREFLAEMSSCILIFYLSTGTLREGKIFWKSFSLISILGHCAKNVALLEFYSSNLSKLLSKFPKVKTEENSPIEFSVSSIFFGHWAEECQIFCREVSGSTFKTACKVSKSVPWGNFISFKIDDIFKNSGLSKLQSLRLEKLLDDVLILIKFCLFSSLDIELNEVSLLAKLFRSKCQNCILCFQKILLRK